LFIPSGTYNTTINVTNDNYQDIIINANLFQMNADTLLGNPIKRVYIRAEATGRSFIASCYNNVTLKDVYLMSPTATSSTFVSGANNLFTTT